MPEWEAVQDQNTTGLSERWRRESGGYEFRVFYQENHILHEPEEIRGLSWILVIRTIPNGGASEYVHYGAYPTEGWAKSAAELWEGPAPQEG
jgi:hypothetical protein